MKIICSQGFGENNMLKYLVKIIRHKDLVKIICLFKILYLPPNIFIFFAQGFGEKNMLAWFGEYNLSFQNPVTCFFSIFCSLKRIIRCCLRIRPILKDTLPRSPWRNDTSSRAKRTGKNSSRISH